MLKNLVTLILFHSWPDLANQRLYLATVIGSNNSFGHHLVAGWCNVASCQSNKVSLKIHFEDLKPTVLKLIIAIKKTTAQTQRNAEQCNKRPPWRLRRQPINSPGGVDGL